MTVTYNSDISNSDFARIIKLIFYRWRGSVWQCVYRELLVWLGAYMVISFTYRFALDSEQRDSFEQVVLSCKDHVNSIPITFLLGFYVSLVVNRWWETFAKMPWPDLFTVKLIMWVEGTDERAKSLRKTLARHLLLLVVLLYKDVSLAVHKRFPTNQHIVDAGIMTEEERISFEGVDNSLGWGKWWVPSAWMTTHLRAARREGYIKSDEFVRNLIDQLISFHQAQGSIFDLDWINIPLVYTQVAHLSVRFYFLVSLIGRQYLDPSKTYPGYEIDMYFPLFTVIQFISFMGWLKVAEVGINPWGEDDDDFEINFLIDRHLQVLNTYLYMTEHGPTTADDGSVPLINQLPYTEGSVGLMAGNQQSGSVANVPVSRKESTVVSQMTAEQIIARRKPSHQINMAVENLKQRMARRSVFQPGSQEDDADQELSAVEIVRARMEAIEKRTDEIKPKLSEIAEISEPESDQ